MRQLPSQSTSCATDVLRSLFVIFGILQVIVSDKKRALVSSEMQSFFKLNMIKQLNICSTISHGYKWPSKTYVDRSEGGSQKTWLMEVFPAGHLGFCQATWDTVHHNAENAYRANVSKAADIPRGCATPVKAYSIGNLDDLDDMAKHYALGNEASCSRPWTNKTKTNKKLIWQST